jgi:epoxyqueuosine reductase
VDYPNGLTDKTVCTAHSIALGKRSVSPCGICIKVCPVGEDRKVFSREDVSVYDLPKRDEALQRAWRHVRAYGGRK